MSLLDFYRAKNDMKIMILNQWTFIKMTVLYMRDTLSAIRKKKREA